MIDLHSHILRGIDDGARTLVDSLEIARAAAEDGITVIAGTPHVRDDWPTEAALMEDRVAELQAALDEAAIPLAVRRGGEIAIGWLDRLSADELRRFALGGSRHLLVETPYHGWPHYLGDAVLALFDRGLTPVLAHPERNAEVQAHPERLVPLVEAGVLVQVTAASVDGRIGRQARDCGRRLVGDGLAHLLASDAHHASVRAVGLASAAKAAGGGALAEWLTVDVPAAILADEEIPPRPPSGRSGRLGRFFSR
ncbi:MAG TPA: CpsB/CapC family capsule biosynthesis tyrosine phosphatase [Gaiellaceae bacterium]|jgi:protein-tyrosine phosphatase